MLGPDTVRNAAAEWRRNIDRTGSYPLRTTKEAARHLLTLERFKPISMVGLLTAAKRKMPNAGISDRATAIAVLIGA